MSIVERIKEKCAENKTNIATIERNTGIGNGVIRRWDERKPGAYQVLEVAKCLNTSIEWLLTGKDSKDFTPEEENLVNLYRKADSRGKRNIMNAAEQEAREQESYTSKIG